MPLYGHQKQILNKGKEEQVVWELGLLFAYAAEPVLKSKFILYIGILNLNGNF